MPQINPDTPTGHSPRAHGAETVRDPAPPSLDAGARGRVAHRLATGAFLTAAGYSLMVIWSLLGGPVSPDTLMPFSAPHPHPPVSTVRPEQPRPLPPSDPSPPAPSSGPGR